MAKIIVIFLCFIPCIVLAQVTDDFSDGDFANNPAWMGDVTEFMVNASFQLQSNGPAASATISLATASTWASNCEWQFWLRNAFNPSSSNFCRIYLLSDQSNLEGSLQGYYLQIGGVSGNNDAIDLYRQDGTTSTKILSGIAGYAGKNDNIIRVRVLRDANGSWEVYADTTGGNNFVLQGTASDNTYTSSNFLGVVCVHTSTRNQSFYFDDFYAGPIQVDTTPPSVSSLNVLNNTTLQVLFSEGVTLSSAQNVANYTVNNGIGSPSGASLLNANTVELTFSIPFPDGQTNQLTVQNIADYANNVLATQTIPFTYYAPAVAIENDVVFNELFPDPDPPVALPNAEFIELYNRSNKNLNLQNWTLSDKTTTITLPAYDLAPHAYLILCSTSNVSAFSSYGPTLGVGTLPSLNNTSDVLTLKNQNGTLIDSVAYNDTWYKDAAKKGGGWTLERIHYDHFCRDSANWSASVDGNGGTPGNTNSVFQQFTDVLSPQPVSLTLLNPTTLHLTFNEAIDLASASNPSQYVLDNGIGPAQSVHILSPTALELTFSSPLQPSTLYELSVYNIKDCLGNLNPFFTMTVGIPEPAAPYDVVLNEIMADPDPVVGLPEVEFVEIYNRSNKILDLSNWTLSDELSSGTFPAPTIVLPHSYYLLTSSSAAMDLSAYGNTIALTSFPSLNNSGELLVLKDANGNLIDFVRYKVDWYQDAVKEQGGWSLERIDPYACRIEGNWAASIDPSGGTPGKANSIQNTLSDLAPPALQQIFLLNANTISVLFNETMDGQDLANTQLFDLQPNIGTPTQAIPHLEGNQVDLVFPFALDSNQVYTLTVQNIRDCSGNVASVLSGQVAVPVRAQAGEIVINEILYEPRTGSKRYVEVYNRTGKWLGMGGWKIGRANEADSVYQWVEVPPYTVLPPYGYLAFSEDTQNVKKEYVPPAEARLVELEASLPAYDEVSDKVVLWDEHEQTIDAVRYHRDWHYKDLVSREGVALERLSPDEPSQTESNWFSASASVHFGTPGYRNSQSYRPEVQDQVFYAHPKVFSPDFDGWEDVLALHYSLPQSDNNIRLTIFDSEGRIVKVLKNNILLGSETGYFLWDGTDASNRVVQIGTYIAVMEIVHIHTGKKEVFKDAFVVAKKQ